MKRYDILEIIGICLIIVAMISAYGLYYTSNEYAKVTETRLNMEANITAVSVSFSYDGARITVDGVIKNPSRLDIDVYFIEIRVYVSSETTSPTLKNFVGLASGTGGLEGTINAKSSDEFSVLLNLDNGSKGFDLLTQNTAGGGGYFLLYHDEAVKYRVGLEDLVDSISIHDVVWVGV